MIHKAYSPTAGVVHVTFELPSAIWASQVYLTVDFVKEQSYKTPMRQKRDGAWYVTLDLPIGSCYKYRYLIDQCWYTEWSVGTSVSHKVDPQFSILDLALPL